MRFVQVTLLLPKIANDLSAGTTRRIVSINPSQIIVVSEPDQKAISGAGCYIGTVLGEWAVAEARELVLDLIEIACGNPSVIGLRKVAEAHLRKGHSAECSFMLNHQQECDCGLSLATLALKAK